MTGFLFSSSGKKFEKLCKVFSLFVCFSLMFQLFSGAFFYKPAFAGGSGGQITLLEVQNTNNTSKETYQEEQKGELGGGEFTKIADEEGFRFNFWQIFGIVIVGIGLIILIIDFFFRKKE